jgi:ornithine carbamoyltransferase
MKHPSDSRRLWAAAQPSPADLDALLAAARKAERAAGRARPLEGKRIAVLCREGASASAAAVTEAAVPLGAEVVRLDVAALAGGPAEIERTAALLERLYDALVCDGIDAATLRALDRATDVPVFDALAAPGHPAWRLADLLLDGAAPTEPGSAQAAAHRAVVQGLLLEAIE